jgi:hypothetical protein
MSDIWHRKLAFKTRHVSHFSFWMKLEQYAINKFLHFRKMNAAEIHGELALYSSDGVSIVVSVHHRVHEFEIDRVSIRDGVRPRLIVMIYWRILYRMDEFWTLFLLATKYFR